MLVDGMDETCTERSKEERSKAATARLRICVGLPRQFSRSGSAKVRQLPVKACGVATGFLFIFLRRCSFCFLFINFTPLRHLRHSIASSVRASEPLHIQEPDSISQLTQFETPQTWVMQWWD
jgi:hypothetical protein